MTALRSLFARFESVWTDRESPIASPDDLIGFFQKFRPDGSGLHGLLEGLHGSEEATRRLKRLFAVAGSDRRPDGSRDAYFIVRQSCQVDPDQASRLAHDWIESVGQWAASVGDAQTASVTSPVPRVRILEGKPPKPPKQEADQSSRYLVFRDRVPNLLHRSMIGTPAVAALGPAFYFIACDATLRDYFLWPLLENQVTADFSAVDAGLSAYFELWKNGIKFRIIGDETIDFYLPRDS